MNKGSLARRYWASLTAADAKSQVLLGENRGIGPSLRRRFVASLLDISLPRQLGVDVARPKRCGQQGHCTITTTRLSTTLVLAFAVAVSSYMLSWPILPSTVRQSPQGPSGYFLNGFACGLLTATLNLLLERRRRWKAEALRMEETRRNVRGHGIPSAEHAVVNHGLDDRQTSPPGAQAQAPTASAHDGLTRAHPSRDYVPSEPGDVSKRRRSYLESASVTGGISSWSAFFVAGSIATAVISAFFLGVTLEILGATVAALLTNVAQGSAAFAAAAACFYAAQRLPLESKTGTEAVRRGWRLLGGSALAWGLGQAVWTWYEMVGGRSVPFPSLADIGFLCSIPLAAAALLTFSAGFGGRAGRVRMLMDGIIIALSLLGITWIFVLGPLLAQEHVSWLERALGIAYPVGDVAIGSIVLAALARTRWRESAPFMLIALATIALAVADSSFLYLTPQDGYTTGSLIDLGWIGAYICITLAALHPNSGKMRIEGPTQVSVGRLALPYGALVFFLAVTAWKQLDDGRVSAFLIVNGLAIVLLISVRQFFAIAENRQLSEQLMTVAGQLLQFSNENRFLAVTDDLRFDLSAIREVTTALESTRDTQLPLQSWELLYALNNHTATLQGRMDELAANAQILNERLADLASSSLLDAENSWGRRTRTPATADKGSALRAG